MNRHTNQNEVHHYITLTCFTTQGFQVCSHIPVGTVGQLQQLRLGEQVGDPQEQFPKDIEPVLSIRDSNLNLFIKSSRSAQCSIQSMRAICGPEDQHLSLTSFLTKQRRALFFFCKLRGHRYWLHGQAWSYLSRLPNPILTLSFLIPNAPSPRKLSNAYISIHRKGCLPGSQHPTYTTLSNIIQYLTIQLF